MPLASLFLLIFIDPGLSEAISKTKDKRMAVHTVQKIACEQTLQWGQEKRTRKIVVPAIVGNPQARFVFMSLTRQRTANNRK